MATAPPSGGFVVPGDRLGAAAEHDAGPGTYVRDGAIFASRVGARVETPAPAAGAAGGGGGRPVLSVARPAGDEPVVPAVGSVVLARVTRIAQLSVSCEIVVVDGAPLPEPAAAVIRRENVRETGEIDKIVMIDCFRPGDVVRAAVVSLGDARAYYLSTAEPHLGVVHAVGEGGGGGPPLVPVGPDAMVDPATGRQERRKVARVDAA